MRIAFLLVTLALSLNMYKCANSSASQSDAFSPGDYDYSASIDGKKLVSGRLTLTEVKGSNIKGTWELKQTGSAENLGPQTGTGDFVGSIEEDRVFINLNPSWADNNIFLNGKFAKGELRGDWHFSTFAGATTKGTFVAKRR